MSGLTENDKAALVAILARYTRFWHERDRDQKLKAEIDARIEGHPALFQQYVAAFNLFGITAFSEETWTFLRKELGDDRYFAAVRLGVAQAKGVSPSAGGDAEAADLKASVENEVTPKVTGSIREIVLKRLQEAGPRGTKASELRELIEVGRGTKLHEKTVGMTLYRLANEGLARREGRVWFHVPQDSARENPGADTPGQKSIFD